jgi:hypothetical protein
MAALWRRAIASSSIEPFELHPPKESARSERQLRISASTIKLVAFTLAEYFNGDGEAWPSTKLLARGPESSAKPRAHAQLSERTVTYALDALVDRGWLVEVRERRGTTTVYKVAWPAGQFERVSGLQRLQEVPQLLQEGVQPLQEGGATVAPEVGFEVLHEEIQEVPGGFQLELKGAKGASIDEECLVCGQRPSRLVDGRPLCEDHLREAAA